MMRSAVFQAILAMTLIGSVGGCSVGIRSVFHSTDPTYSPKPGPTPRVYLAVNRDDVPRTGMRSVGLIEVTVPESSGIRRAIDVAAAKGRDLGCWILIEESIFASVQSRAALDRGATVILAHGGGGDAPSAHGPAGSGEGKLTAQFHCVVEGSTSRVQATAPVWVATPNA